MIQTVKCRTFAKRRGKPRLYRNVIENSPHRAVEKNIRVLLHQRVSRQRPTGFVPLINPVDHADQGKGGRPRRDRRRGITLALDVGDEVLDEVQVILLASVDFSPERGWKRMILVQHNRNLAVFGTEHNLDVQPDQRAQALFGSLNAGSLDAAYNIDDPFLGDLHGMRHDVEQDFVFRLEVVIEAALGEIERGGDIVHGSGIVSLLLKKARGGTQDLLARLLARLVTRVDGSFAKHSEMVSRNGASTLLCRTR